MLGNVNVCSYQIALEKTFKMESIVLKNQKKAKVGLPAQLYQSSFLWIKRLRVHYCTRSDCLSCKALIPSAG